MSLDPSQLVVFAFGVVASVIAGVLFELLLRPRLEQWRATKPTRQFWDFIDEEICLVLSAHLIDRGPQRVAWVSWGDVRAYHDLEAFLRARIGRAADRRVSLVGSEEPLDKTRHLVMLGGPFTSKAALDACLSIYRRLDEESKKTFPCPAGFWKGRFDSPTSVPTYDNSNIQEGVNSDRIDKHSDLVICNRDGADSKEPNYNYSSESGSDFGVIIKCDNPDQPGKRVVMLYGISDLSTAAMTTFAIRDDLIRNLVGSSARNIWGVVEARFERAKLTGLMLRSQGKMVFDTVTPSEIT